MNTPKIRTPLQLTAIGRCSSAVWLAAGIQLLASPRLQAVTAERQITDAGITAVVERGLRMEKGVIGEAVDVSTSQGIVTLSGSVDNLLANRRAVMIAESIRGVRGVIEETAVTPVARSDGEINQDIAAALKQDPATASYHVTASVQEGVATLTGSVGSYNEKRLSARIAEGIKGVKAVHNDITINYAEKSTDSQIVGDVTARLQWDVWINGELIKAAVKDGQVTLTGTIGSAISRSRALDDAWVVGVTAVDANGLKVEPRVGTGAHREHEFAERSRSQIKQAVEATLLLDPRIAGSVPTVMVEGGGVILSGNVGNLKAKTSAEQDAKNVVGVWRVDNLLKVRPSAPITDAEMERQLRAALAWDSMLDSNSITATVSHRIVHLSGTVDSGLQKAEAQDVASRINGVGSVRNNLKAQPEYATYYYDDYAPNYAYGDWPYYSYYGDGYGGQFLNYDYGRYEPQLYLTDEQIKNSIRDEFFWSPFVDNSDVNVTVKNGVATLTGTVGTRLGLSAISSDAYEGGASRVVDQVTLKNHAWWWWW